MKRALLLPLAAALPLLLGACAAHPVAGKQDNWRNYPQLRVEDPWLDDKLGFQPPVVQIAPASGLAKVDVTINNNTWDDLRLEYSFSFTDRGALIDGPSPYMRLDLPKGTTQHIVFNSIKPIPPAPQGDFKLEIRRFR